MTMRDFYIALALLATIAAIVFYVGLFQSPGLPPPEGAPSAPVIVE